MSRKECILCKLLYGRAREEERKSFENRVILKFKYWVCAFDHEPLTPGHIIIIYKTQKPDESHVFVDEIEGDAFNELYRVFNECCEKLEKIRKNYPYKKLNLASLNAAGRKVYENKPKGHLHFHIIPEYEFEFDEKLEWHRMYPTKNVNPGFWYFGYREYKRNKQRNELGYKDKIKEQFKDLKKLMNINPNYSDKN